MEENPKLFETAIDLSFRSGSSNQNQESDPNDRNEINNQIVRPIPRPPWSILWYQNLWTNFVNHQPGNPRDIQERNKRQRDTTKIVREDFKDVSFLLQNPTFKKGENEQRTKEPNLHDDLSESVQVTPIVDIASCDGPVKFERISNPNFALTVEHLANPPNINKQNSPESTDPAGEMNKNTAAMKAYLCIYCNQSFKSLFCYQKHKKRHLNPVSVDISTSSNTQEQNFGCLENKTKTKDINVQFFPCKKCGSKFPSYYFVHKHKRTCH